MYQSQNIVRLSKIIYIKPQFEQKYISFKYLCIKLLEDHSTPKSLNPFSCSQHNILPKERLFKITNNCPLSTHTKIPRNLQYFCSLYFLPLIVPRNQVYSYTIPIGIKGQKYVTHSYICELIYIYIYIYNHLC